MNKTKVFQNELSWIADDDIRKFATLAISKLPDYFFKTAASSTGKYHPAYALGDGGLIRHTKAAVAVANDLLSLEMYGKYTQDERDIIIVALILHDGLKHGLSYSKYTMAEHPNLIADWIIQNVELSGILHEEMLILVTEAIRSHMGQWNTDYRTKKEILPKPRTAVQKFVHMCDYLASRKYLEFDFGGDYYNPDDYKVKEEITDPLKSKIDEILILCKQRVADGADKESLFKVISNNNGGNKNPNSIADIETATKILNLIGSDAV